jgi:mxaA protein
MPRSLGLLLFLLASSFAWAGAPAARLQVSEPRAFGHTLGDVLERRVVLELDRPLRLADDALPRPGRIGAWLELSPPQVQARPGAGHTRYEITLSYQVVNSPREIVTLALPEVVFSLEGGPRRAMESVPDFPFTLAPLTPEHVLARAPLDEMQPAAAPPRIDTGGLRLRLAAYGVAAGAILLFLAGRLWGIPFLTAGRGPFALACRELRRLSRSSSDGTRREAIRRVHRAFDRTAGRALFAAELPAFLREHPRYAPLAPDIERFFELSRREFFAGGAAEPDLLPWLAGFCAACRGVERGTR